MDGAKLRREREYDLAIAQAWHTAIFALNGYSGKLKGKKLSDYLIAGQSVKYSSHAQGIAYFHRLKARGIAVEITRH